MRSLVHLCTSALLLAACNNTLQTQPAPTATATITGKVKLTGVTDASGVAITAVGPSIASGASAADGSYSLGPVIPGVYLVTGTVDDSLERTRSTVVTVATTAAASDLTFTILGTLSGTATRTGGTSNAGIELSILGSASNALTDATGKYQIGGVPLGSVALSAAAAGYVPASQLVTVARGTTTVPAFALSLIPPAPTVTLSITVQGSGLVASSPAGIGCNSTCSATFAPNSSVTLVATPAAGYTFTSWSSSACNQATCVLTLAQSTSLTATFTARPLTVETIGPGKGTVTSLSNGAQVTLTATADPGYLFVGWQGDCSGTGSCSVTPPANVQAAFTEAFFYANGNALPYAIYGVGLQGGPLSDFSTLVDLGANSFSVSPDGLSIAFGSYWNGNGNNGSYQNLWLLDLVTGAATQLTKYTTAASINGNAPPLFSPDGSTIAFLSNQDPTKTTEATISGDNLWTVKRDGTGLGAVTTYVSDELLQPGFNEARVYDWSPDGTMLAFVATPPAPAGDVVPAVVTTYANVFTIHVDGTALTQVTQFNSGTVNANPYSVSWSPDGSKVGFISTQAAGTNNTGGTTTGPQNAWTATLATSTLFCVSCSAPVSGVYDAFYARSGHGMVLEATTQEGDVNPTDLYSINDDGTAATNLTNYTNSNDGPYGAWWHLDQTTLLYSYYQDNALGIWAIPASGGGPVLVFAAPNEYASTPYANEEDD